MTDKSIHEEFCRAMQEAWEEAVIDTSELKDEDIPAPDLSFLDRLYEEEPSACGAERSRLESGKKRRRAGRFTKVAAAVLIILITGSAMGVFLNSGASYGIRSFVQNIRHLDSANGTETMESKGKSLSISDWGEIQKGKKIVGTLYIPAYIPKGYTFQKAEFAEGTASGGQQEMRTASYYYSSGEKSLTVVISEVEGGSTASISGELEQSPLSGRDLYVARGEEDEEYTITCEEGDFRFVVSAPLSKRETVNIVEGITKQEN